MAKTGYGNFDYTCLGVWRGAAHQFSIIGNHSGNAFTTASDMSAFMTGTASPYGLCFGPLQSTSITVVKARYYNGVDSTPQWEATYSTEEPAPAPLTATGVAWAATTTEVDDYYPLESVLVMEAQVGLSKTTKPVYARKYLRGIPQGAMVAAAGGALDWGLDAAVLACATKMGSGAWYGGRVYITPTGGQSPNWTALPQVGNHQVPRGRKLKKTSSGTVLSAAEKAALAAAGFVLATD